MNAYLIDELGEADQRKFAGIISRSATDAKFRAELLENPARAIEAETGIVIPEGLRIKFIESKGADLTLVLPNLKGELDDTTLELIAGGDGDACRYGDSQCELETCSSWDIVISIKDSTIDCVIDIP